MRNKIDGKHFVFPAYPTKLFYLNKKGKRNIYYFSIKGRIICYKNKYHDIGFYGKDIKLKLENVDKLLKIEYIRNEKRWKKYNKKCFLHNFNQTEEILGFDEKKYFIRVNGNHKLWGYQKIKDEEVE